MNLNNLSVSFRDSGTGWSFWLVDYNDPSGQTKSPAQDSPEFTADVHGNPFTTDAIYLAASSHPVYGDGLIPFRFDPVTGLPVFIDVDPTHAGNTGGNSTAIGGYPVQVVGAADGQSLAFYTLPGGQRVLINVPPVGFDALTQKAPLLATDYATASNPAITGLMAALTTPAGPILRQMLGEELLAYLLARAPGRLGLNEVVARNPLTNYNLLFGADANPLLLTGPGTERKLKGLVVGVRQADGTYKFSDSVVFDADGSYNETVDGMVRTRITADAYRLTHKRTVISGGPLTVDQLIHDQPPLLTDFDDVMVGKRVNGQEQEGIVSFGQFKRALLNSAEFIAAYGSPKPVAPTKRTILCYDEYDTDSGYMTLSPAKIGQPQPHTLHLPANQIFGRVYYPDGQVAPGYALSYPDADHYQVDYAGASGETSDLIVNLVKRAS